MTSYRSAGQYFHFSSPLLELEPYRTGEGAEIGCVPAVPGSFRKNELICRTAGWIAGSRRCLEVHSTSAGMLLEIEGCSGFLIAAHGEAILKRGEVQDLTALDRQVILGPALVLALALRGMWCLHASAALFADRVFVFPGESGQGKSTLAAHLSNSLGWHLVADDILPVGIDTAGMTVWPHYPQLKLPVAAQPGPALPESLPLHRICVLSSAAQEAGPALQQLEHKQAVEVLLRHTAGTRMFSPKILGDHLSFCSRVARQVPVYQLIYPHRKDALPKVRELLESVC